jgi:hypothetical protein
MDSLIVTVVVVLVLVVVLGGLVITCSLGWARIIPHIIPRKWIKKTPTEKQQSWPQLYPHNKESIETDWVGAPVSSPYTSPRVSRVSSDMLMQHNATPEEIV